MRKITSVALAAFLAGCVSDGTIGPVTSSSSQLEAVTPVALSKPQIQEVEAGTRRSLKDPDSAKFGKVIAGKDSKGIVSICGYVNAKNSFGGYTGDKPFMGILTGNEKKWGFVVAGMGGTEVETLSVLQVCRQQGLAL